MRREAWPVAQAPGALSSRWPRWPGCRKGRRDVDRHWDLCTHPQLLSHPEPKQGLGPGKDPWSPGVGGIWKSLLFRSLLAVSRIPGQAGCTPIGLPTAPEDQKLGQRDDFPRHTSPQGQRGEKSGASGRTTFVPSQRSHQGPQWIKQMSPWANQTCISLGKGYWEQRRLFLTNYSGKYMMLTPC